ncbi:NAD(P)H-flavin oxidoreductase [Novosphingobium endophyticum]|uniref:NAD(P)H-flavin oxidoreductase n=1 Tax=Novosphingobium endophyticum TaxID=1955250 RepID=A0A916TXC3_9SPHN|nr:nitroreductase family protein [Novosphingobium endophyticum]GGC16782.1 NAD(P)H-flavin oxidoreductase [Novosphingobium endophyticum]
MTTNRSTNTDLNPIFLARWSPRAFDGSPLPQGDLRAILDAGRWAPSSYNYQPWRFLYATPDRDATPDHGEIWNDFLDVLNPFNRSWAKDAGALIFIVSETQMGSPEKPNYSHSFDAGAAWMSMALQAHMLGYHAHAVVGFDEEKARACLQVPEHFKVDVAIAIGLLGEKESLPDGLKEREFPSDRKPLEAMAFLGRFKN